MSHIENKEELTEVLLKFLRYLKISAFKYPYRLALLTFNMM
jgi:hypothetical protein